MLLYRYREDKEVSHIGELSKEPSPFIIKTIELIDRYLFVTSVSE